jgi:prepilin-type N-terminal cleavage/methylation domain-containing protein
MDDHRDDGFTLIELMVVVLIIAILLAVAIPTFLGARKRANDRAAQSNLRNTLTNELTYFADAQQFTDDPVKLNDMDPSLSYASPTGTPPATAVPPAGQGIYVSVIQTDVPGDTVLLGIRTPDARCFWIRNVGDKNLPRFGENTCSTDTSTMALRDEW